MRITTIKLTTYAVLMTAMLFLAACKKEKETTLTVSETSLIFKADEKPERPVTIETNADSWSYKTTYQSDGGWMNVNKKSDIENQLFITVTDYTNTEVSRFGIITVYADKAKPVEITVEQLKKPINTLTVIPTSHVYEATETGNKTCYVMTDAPSWDAISSSTWFQVTKQEQQFVINVSLPNETGSERTAEIIVTAGNAPKETVTVTQKKRNTLSVSPTSLTFNPNGSTQTVTVTTDAPSWNATKTENWLTLEFNNNILSVIAAPNTGAERSTTIKFTAGSAVEINFLVTQGGNMPFPSSNYSATGICLYDHPGFNNTSWTGTITWDASTNRYSIFGWGGGFSYPIYLNYTSGNLIVDTKTVLFIDSDGDKVIVCLGYKEISTGNLYYVLEANFPVNYNTTTRLLDFSGTYQGNPTFIIIAAFNSNNEFTGYYYNVYQNAKLQLTTTLSAPQSGSDVQARPIIGAPSGMQIQKVKASKAINISKSPDIQNK